MLYKIIILLFLSSCSFKPSYSPDVIEKLSLIKIEPIQDRYGQLMRNHLLALFNPKNPSAYRLKTTLTYAVSGTLYLPDDTASRLLVTLTTSYILYDTNGKQLTQGTITSTQGYSVVAGGDYSTQVAEEFTKKNVTEIAALGLRTRLAHFFTDHEKKS